MINYFKDLYYENKEECFNAIKVHGNYRELFLELFLELAKDTKKKYDLLGIEEKIFLDTMSDIEIWRQNCLRDFGVNGINEYNWLSLHINLKIFRLGRLQFELVINENEIAYNVHVPQGEPLTYEAVRDSYVQAFKFYRGITNLFLCHSWLLNPILKDVLPKNANIIKFQNDYTIYKTDENDSQCEERVFIKLKENPDEYQEGNQLQAGIKKLLLAGNKIGTSYGMFRFDIYNN